MELRQLEMFIGIAESGAYSRAAMRMAVSQPILSRQVKALEDELGVALFHRTGRGVKLTEAGTQLEGYARSIFETTRSAVHAVKAAGGAPAGPVVLGLPASISTVLSLPLIAAFRRALPNVALKFMEGYSGHLMEWLADGRIDIALLYDTPRLGVADLRGVSVLTDELFLLGPRSDPAGLGNGPIPVARLARTPMVLPSRPHGVRTLVDAALARDGLAPRVFMEIDAMHSTLHLVENGLGYAVLSYPCAATLILQERLRIWRFTQPLTRSLVIATSTQRPSSRAVRSLGTILRCQIQALVDQGKWLPEPTLFS